MPTRHTEDPGDTGGPGPLDGLLSGGVTDDPADGEADGDEAGPPDTSPGTLVRPRSRVSTLARAAAHHTGRRVRTLVSPRVSDALVPGEGEFVVDEVAHHWIVVVPRVVEVLGAVGLFLLTAQPRWPLVTALPGVALLVHAGCRALADHRDRFVITNLRVFRVQGVVSRRTATMPIQRILDITVTVPVPGRLLGYGHLVFESAAQAQGLRDVRYVGSPLERDLTLQRVVQRSGLRRGMERYRSEDLPDTGPPSGRRSSDAGAPARDTGRDTGRDGDDADQGPARARHPTDRRSSRRRRVGFHD